MNDFIKKFVENKSYSKCLIPDNKEYLIQIKKGILPLEEAEELAVRVNKETYQIAKQYISDDNKIDTEMIELLDNVKYKLLEKYFKECLIGE